MATSTASPPPEPLVSRRGLVLWGQLLVGAVLTFLIHRFYVHEEMSYRVVVGLLIPAFPFVILFLLGLIRRKGTPLLRIGHLLGAAIGAFLTVGIPWTVLWYFAEFQSDRGVAIGAGLLILAYPAVLPFTMALAGWITESVRQSRFQARATGEETGD